MHTIEPFYNWRHIYITEEDKFSPFYKVHHNEFTYTKTVYNYFIHPQWDEFGSNTLYLKLIYTDYELNFCKVYCYQIRPIVDEYNNCKPFC